MIVQGRKHCDCGQYFNQHLNHCPHCKTYEAFSTFIPYNPLDWVYDLETYPNIFTAYFYHVNTGQKIVFEISDRKNDGLELYNFLLALESAKCRLVGFNNLGFDYPIIHFFMEFYHLQMTVDELYQKAQSIINTHWDLRHTNLIPNWKVRIAQIDLFKIHHFDNVSRSTSLKLLEFNMRMRKISDLPYPVGTFLNDEQKDVLIDYNADDIYATLKFYLESLEMIEFREKLSERYGKNFLNHNDTKIGKDSFIMRLEEALPGSCYNPDGSPRQTIRHSINLGEVIFPYIQYKHSEFTRVKYWLASQTILETKGVFSDINAVINNFKYDFGVGGIHGSVEACTVVADDEYIIEDWDVASFYPNIAIANNLFPEHLGVEFCSIYKDVYEERQTHKKGTVENAALKLALNGVYGDSNSKFSPFYDSKYTMGITINGQLLLCMLADALIDVPLLKMIQINTDGMTIKYPRKYKDHVHAVCKWWEGVTRLELEVVEYQRMFIRDVNNYIGEYTNGKLKRKGTYEYNIGWHQNHSELIVAKAAEAALVRGESISDFIRTHTDVYDFMLRTKIARGDKLMINGTQESQRITRYYISNTGVSLSKVAPPTKGCIAGQWKRANGLTDAFYQSVCAELRNKPSGDKPCDTKGLPWDERINTKSMTKYGQRVTNINAGFLATICNDMDDLLEIRDINYDYYIEQTNKIVEPILNNRL